MNLKIENDDQLCTYENCNYKHYKIYLKINNKKIYNIESLGLSGFSIGNSEIIKIKKELDNYLLAMKKLLNFPTDLQNIIILYHLADYIKD